MTIEYRNGFGVAYRELQQTDEDLRALWDKGEVRLSPEEIKWRRDALKEISKLKSRINEILDQFEKIAPPPIRKEE